MRASAQQDLGMIYVGQVDNTILLASSPALLTHLGTRLLFCMQRHHAHDWHISVHMYMHAYAITKM